jgi:hypothetical protein
MSCCHLRDCVGAARRLKKLAAPLFPPRGASGNAASLQQLRAADQSEGWLAPTLALSAFPANAGSSVSKAPALGSGAMAIRDVVGVTAPERPDLARPPFHLLRGASVASECAPPGRRLARSDGGARCLDRLPCGALPAAATAA